ncbi:hypothetical protein RCF19_29735 [Rhodococcus qingshengii]
MADMTPEDYAAKWQELSGKDLPADQKDRYKHIFGGGSLFQNMASWIPSIGFLVDYIFNTVDNDYIAQMDVISNHEARLSANEEAIRQSILQGEAVAFESSGWWKPPRNLVYAELIGVAAGAGGAGGKWNVAPTGQRGGSGGGGGGEKHLDGITRLYAEFLPKTGDDYDWIQVSMFLAGLGGGNDSPGGSGGNIIFGSNLPQPLVVFEGGFGAAVGDSIPAVSGNGGSGMIPGGRGGYGAQTPQSGSGGTNGSGSISPYSFAGGGGGGGGGACSNFNSAGTGGGGVATTGGGPGQSGVAPNRIIAAGGSGGGGARNASEPGGAGGFPGGGGGGGFGGATSSSNGGKGGEAKLWVIETKNESA